MTNVERLKFKFGLAKQDICALLEITEAEYDIRLIDFGLEFLAYFTSRGGKIDKGVYSKLLKSANYWAWWRNEYAIMDTFFISRLFDKFCHLKEYDLDAGIVPSLVWFDAPLAYLERVYLDTHCLENAKTVVQAPPRMVIKWNA